MDGLSATFKYVTIPEPQQDGGVCVRFSSHRGVNAQRTGNSDGIFPVYTTRLQGGPK